MPFFTSFFAFLKYSVVIYNVYISITKAFLQPKDTKNENIKFSLTLKKVVDFIQYIVYDENNQKIKTGRFKEKIIMKKRLINPTRITLWDKCLHFLKYFTPTTLIVLCLELSCIIPLVIFLVILYYFIF